MESWARDFQQLGHTVVAEAQEADLMVFNTCAVTSEAVRKSRQRINRLHKTNPEAKLIVSGCHVTLSQQQAIDKLGVDLVIKNNDKDRLVQISNKLLALPTMPQIATLSDENPLFKRNRQRAFIKIQDGCRYRCTFCIVTVARGNERSRSLSDIIAEINQYVAQGIREIVLTGVHVGGYGSDINGNLFSLIKAIISDTEVERIRFASVEPWDLPETFFSLFENSRLMPHMHLPLQSGSDRILRKMARRCRTADYRTLLKSIRSQVSHFNISSDIIVGFPGETEQDWRESLRFIEEMQFSQLHIFSYSPREGTKAAKLPDQLSSTCKKERSQQLHELASRMKDRTLQKNLHNSHQILWESRSKSTIAGNCKFKGYTANYIRVETEVNEHIDLENTITGFKPESVNVAGQLLLGRVNQIN